MVVRTLSRRKLSLVAAIFAALLVAWMYDISGSPIEGDALATVIPAVNLQHHQSFSLRTSAPYTPTMYREPIPIFTTAAVVALVDARLGKAELADYYSGERARLLKLQNILWLTALVGAAFVTTGYFTRSFALSVAMAVVSYLVFLYPAFRNAGVDSLSAEISAAALLLLASWCYAIGAMHRNRRVLAAAGVLFAVLTLIKASALYVFVGLLLALPLLSLLRGESQKVRANLSDVSVLALAFVVVISPWAYRNWVQFGTLAITERGGLALYHRALFNELEGDEYRGLFYVWAPSPMREATGRLLGFTAQDLERGGRLFRLNGRTRADDNRNAERAGRPQDATSIMSEGRAERVKLREFHRQAGYGHRANVKADDELRARAISMMLNNPLGALRVTIAAMWRGGFLLAPLFAVIAVYSLRRRRHDVLAFCLPAMGLTLFYALFSHFQSRYGALMTPVALVGVAIVAFEKGWLHRFASFARNAAPRRRRIPARAPAVVPESTSARETA